MDPNSISDECAEFLRLFLAEHSQHISMAAITSVCRYYLPPRTSDPVATAREREDVLIIDLSMRPHAACLPPKWRFRVVDARLETLGQSSFTPDVVDHLRIGLVDYKAHSIGMGGVGAVILVVLRVADGSDVGSNLKLGQVVPKPFDLPGREWLSLPLDNVRYRECLMKMLNEGDAV